MLEMHSFRSSPPLESETLCARAAILIASFFVATGVVIDGNEHLPAFGDEEHRAGLVAEQKAWFEDLAKHSTGLVNADENGFEKLHTWPGPTGADAASEPSE